MGLFNFFGQVNELNKLSNAVGTIKSMLDDYHSEEDDAMLFVAAWLCKAGVTDLMDKNQWPMHYVFYVPIDGTQTKLTMMQAQMMTSSRIMMIASMRCSEETKKTVFEILDGGPAFDLVDSKVPQDLRRIIE